MLEYARGFVAHSGRRNISCGLASLFQRILFLYALGKMVHVCYPVRWKTDVYVCPCRHASYFAPECDKRDAGLAQVGNETSSFGTVWRQCNIDGIAMIESESIVRF